MRLKLGAAVVITALAVLGGQAAVAPSSASASTTGFFVEVEPGVWGFRDSPTAPIQNWRMTQQQWEAVVRASEAAQLQEGATGQSAANMGLSATDAANGAQVATDTQAAGSAADGALLAEASDAGLLPAAGGLGAVSMVAAGAGAGVLGWLIGSEIRDLLIGESNGTGVKEKNEIPITEKMYARGETVNSGEGPPPWALKMSAVGAVVGFGYALGEVGPHYLLDEVTECTKGYEVENHPMAPYPTKDSFTAPTGAALQKTGVKVPLIGSAGSEGHCVREYAQEVKTLQAVSVGQGFKSGTNVTSSAPSAVSPSTLKKKTEENLQNTGYGAENGILAKNKRKIAGALGVGVAVSVLIPTPTSEENYKEYDATLEELNLNPEPLVLPENATDLKVGPEVVTQTLPAPGTSVKEGTNVKVRYNPANAPLPGGSAWSPPTLSKIELPSFGGFSCSVFPFGVPCYFGGFLSGMAEASPKCPEFHPVLRPGSGPTTINFCVAEPVMTIWRPIVLVLAIVGIVMWMGNWAAKQGDG